MTQILLMIVLFYLCVFRFATCSGDYAFDGEFFYTFIYYCIPVVCVSSQFELTAVCSKHGNSFKFNQ